MLEQLESLVKFPFMQCRSNRTDGVAIALRESQGRKNISAASNASFLKTLMQIIIAVNTGAEGKPDHGQG